MARDLFEEAGINPGGRDLFEEAGIAPGQKKRTDDRGALDTAKDYASTIASEFAGAVANTAAGIGGFVQAPAANSLAMVAGARGALDRGVSAAINAVMPPDNVMAAMSGVAPPGAMADLVNPKASGMFQAKPNDEIQQTAQQTSRFAADQRAANVDVEGGSWLNPRTMIARVGLGLQEASRGAADEIDAFERRTNPELVRQQQEVAKAEGFVPTIKAMVENPMATVGSMARSLPDMLGGLALSRAAAGRAMAGASTAADTAAARVAAAGGDIAAQGAAAKAAIDQAAALAVARASTTGTLAEAASSANSAREGVYREVMGLPAEKIKQSPRFQEILRETGGDAVKAQELLANELADQAPLLTGTGTLLGSAITHRLFGGDTTAKAVAGQRMGVRDVVKNIAEEGTEESLQGIGEDAAQFGASEQADPSKKFDLGGSVAQNMVAGALMGGAGTGVRASQQAVQARLKPAGEAAAPAAPGAGPAPTAVDASEVLGAAPGAGDASIPEGGGPGGGRPAADPRAGAQQREARLAELDLLSQQRHLTDDERGEVGVLLAELERADNAEAERVARAAGAAAPAAAQPERWAEFPTQMGGLGVPRAEMPQVAADHRGALVQYLAARGVGHEQVELDGKDLKPTQAEYSPDKVAKFADEPGSGGRSVLISSDGYVLDGHHQWVGSIEAGQPVRAIRLEAPIRELLPLVREFPSAGQAEGGTAAAPVVTAERALLQQNQITALDRVHEIDGQLAARAADDPMAAELRTERAQITKNWPQTTPGADTTFTTEAGARVGAQYALVDVGDLVTSHNESLRPNEAYPQALQPRQRERAASAQQINGIVQKLDPARLGQSADAATGAPIIGADGIVESGNARSISLKRIYTYGGQKAADYKAWLREHAHEFGLTPEAVDAREKPVLVRVRTTPVDRAEFARQANASTVAQMSPAEQARSDANRIDAMDDLQPDEQGDFATSRDFIRRFVARLPVTEQAGMVDAAGHLSSAGYARVRNAVLAKAYGDSPVLTRMVESMDDRLRNISRALMIAAPTVAQARAAIGAGALHDIDITPHLVEAVDALAKLKEHGMSVEDALAQAGIFGEQYSPETRTLLAFLGENTRRPRRIAEFIKSYFEALDAVGDPRQAALLSLPEPTREMLLTAAAKGFVASDMDTSPRTRNFFSILNAELTKEGAEPVPTSLAPEVADVLRAHRHENRVAMIEKTDRLMQDIKALMAAPGPLLDRLKGVEGRLAEYDAAVSGDRRMSTQRLMQISRHNPTAALPTGRASESEVAAAAPAFGQPAKPDPRSRVPVTAISGAEIDAAAGDTPQQRAVAWMRDHLQGKAFDNVGTGWSISVGRRGINKTTNHAARESHARSVAALPGLLREAVLVWSEDNRNPAERADVPRVHHFYAPLRIGGSEYLSRIVVKETRAGQKFYDHDLSDEISPATLDADANLPEEGAASTEAGPTTWSMGRVLAAVKAEHGGTAPLLDISRVSAALARSGWEKQYVPRMQAARRLAGLVKQLDEGKITPVAFEASVRALSGAMDRVVTTKAVNRVVGERERGADIVREKLIRARRQGDLDPDTVEFALWALDQNPALADGLGISLVAPRDGTAAGDYNPAAAIIRVFKGSEKTDTAVHEILHHTERMMPPAMQEAIRSEWARALARAIEIATPEQRAALENIPAAMMGVKAAHEALVEAIQKGPLNYPQHYQLVNPSEFWAVNASRILGGRFARRDAVWGRVRTWLGGMVEKVKGLLGLRSDAPVIRALDALLRHDGSRQAARMLSDRGAGAGGATHADLNTSGSDSGPEHAQGPWAAGKAALARLTDPALTDRFIYEFQDKFIDLKNVQRRIAAASGTVSDLNDAYLGEELYHKRVAKRTEDFLEEELRPLLEDLHRRGASIEEFERYLHARHAPEANAALAERNPNQRMVDDLKAEAGRTVRELQTQLEKARRGGSSTASLEKALAQARQDAARYSRTQAFDGTEAQRTSLSGMSNEEAAAVMAGLTAERRADFDALAARVDAINAKTLKTLEDYGLMGRAALDAWRKGYQFYVPLHRDEAHVDSVAHPIGQGFSVKGDAARRRVGSNEKVTHILGHIAMQREAALTRGEKNLVVKKLYLLAAQNPDKTFWRVDAPPKTSTVDPETGFVRTGIDPGYKNRPNVLMVRIAGRDAAITFNEHNPEALRLAAALKNLDVSDLHVVLSLAGKATRWFAAVNTQYNPVFGVINFARDLQEGLINLSTTPLAGKQLEVASNVLKAMRAIYRAERGKTATDAEWRRLWKEMQDVGGTTGYRDLFTDAKDRAKALQRELHALDRGKVSQAAHAVVDWLGVYNETMENAVRLSAYKVALDEGLTRERAASVAKNLTVNFNRKGHSAREIGALYAFFNAAIQGTTRMWETLRGPAGRKIMLGGVLLGVMNTLLGMAVMGGGGDDSEDEWEKIPEFVKERSIIIPLGRQDYISIPLPLGFKMLPNIGRLATEFAFGGSDKSAGRQLGKLLMTLADTFNPLGGAQTPEQLIAPTVIDPIAALLANRDWTGRPIYREDRDPMNPQPGHTLAKDSASTVGHGLAVAINRVTGGTEYRPGMWSPTPDQIDYVIGQFTGGLGRELLKLNQTIAAPFTGDELPAHKVPLLGRLYGNTRGASAQTGQFYENVKMLNELENEVKGRDRNDQNVDGFIAGEPLTSLIDLGNSVEREVRHLRTERRKVVEQAEPGYRDELRDIDQQIGEAMGRLNAAVSKVRRTGAPG